MNPSPSSTTPRPRVGFQLGSTQLEGEANLHFQRRLTILAAFTAVAVNALFLLAILTGGLQGLLDPGWWFQAATVIHAISCVVSISFWIVLLRRPHRVTTLKCIDAAILFMAIATILGAYLATYEYGMRSMTAFLVIWIIARAVLVPSTAARTIWLSAPAALALLAIHIHFGFAYDLNGHVVEGDLFWFGQVPWTEASLVVGIGIAAIASGTNFALRSEVAEAKQLGQYKLDDLIGAGSMGEVYHATHALLRRPTAIKLIRPEMAGAETLRRFHREVRQTSRLSHPNTISIYDYGHTDEGVFYYAMELLDGANLKEVVEETGTMPASRVIWVLRHVCGALHEAHGLGLIHRDIKPGNIVLCSRGGIEDVVKVLDFGLVKDMRSSDASLTRMGDICGTPETLAPEVLSGNPVTPAADLYSLSVVGYFLLTGYSVFDAGTIAEYVGHHLHSKPPPLRDREPTVPADLERVILKGLAKDPRDRYASAADFRTALLACADAHTWSETDAATWWQEYRLMREAEGRSTSSSTSSSPSS